MNLHKDKIHRYHTILIIVTILILIVLSVYVGISQSVGGAYIIMAAICLVLLAVLLYIGIDSGRKHRAALEEKDRVVQSYEQILVATATDTYKGIRRLDLETGQSDYLFFKNQGVQQIATGDWSAWVNTQEKNVHPHDWNRLREFLMLDNLRKLEDGVTYQENYRSVVKNEKGYYNTYSTTISITYLEGRRTALLTTIDNTAAVVNEIEQKHLLLAAASIYVSMYIIDMKNNRFETLSGAEHISHTTGEPGRNVQTIVCDIIQRHTDEQYLDVMLDFVNLDTLDERMQGVKTITQEFIRATGAWCRGRFIAVEYDGDHRLSKVLWMVEDIDAEKRKANHLKYLSETDLMTGICNRGSGEKRIKELIASGHEGMFGLLDVDKFKSINDSCGHGVGDRVLIEIARCLKESFRDTDTVMRLGGDEFAVFADGTVDEDTGAALIERFFNNVADIDIPELGGRRISVSLGAAFMRQGDDVGFEALYHNADSCTYRSKKMEGSAYSFFEGNTL